MILNRSAAAAVLALTVLSFYRFPGHTWLQQDSQIWLAVLEHQRDAAVLRNDPVAQQPHTAYTLYDEVTLALSGVSGFGLRESLTFQQVLSRALGIGGLYLMATASGLTPGLALLVAAI